MKDVISHGEYKSHNIGTDAKLYGFASRVDNYSECSRTDTVIAITPPPGSSSLKNKYDLSLAKELSNKYSLPVFLFENPGKNRRGNPERDYFVPFSIEQLVCDKVAFREYLLSQKKTHVIEIANSLSLGSSAKANSILGPSRGSNDYLLAASPALLDAETIQHYIDNGADFHVHHVLGKAPTESLTQEDILHRYCRVNGLHTNTDSFISLRNELERQRTGISAIDEATYAEVAIVLNKKDVLFTKSLEAALTAKPHTIHRIDATGSDVLNHNMGNALEQQTASITDTIGLFLKDIERKEALATAHGGILNGFLSMFKKSSSK